ncbi:MAG: general secretion pathway protein GspK [Candidatus Omnitrophica bacterium]|nr:general secretion pathway protein GspK [Candidatus Omnitrophota bacterium]
MIIAKAVNSLKQSASRLAVNNKGGILIISLWSLCLLSIFALNLGYGVRQKIILVQRLDERSKLHFIAVSGVKSAIVSLKKEGEEETDIEKMYDSLSDGWSDNMGAFKDIQVGDGTFSVSYDYIDERADLLLTRYGLIDEERKININKIDQTVLRDLFRNVLDFNEIESQELAASIVDWRDSDSELSIALGSAEDYDYRTLTYPYEAKDAEIEVLEELLLVKGMSVEFLNKLRDYITIYGDGKININTASKDVFLALGLDRFLAEKILLFRKGEDGVITTPDDNIFEQPSNIVSDLSQYSHLSEFEVAELNRVVDRYLGTKSDHFMVKSVAKLNNKRNTTEVICVINRNGKILYWHEEP